MSLLGDAAKFLLDTTYAGTILTSDLYKEYIAPVLEPVSPVLRSVRQYADAYYSGALDKEPDNNDKPNDPGDPNNDADHMDDINRQLEAALKEIDSLEGMLQDQSNKQYTQVVDIYKGDTNKLIQLENAIADMREELSRAQLQSEQARDRLAKQEEGLRAQSVGGQRKAMKEAIAKTRDDQRTITQNIQALTSGIARHEANMANIAKVEAMTPSDINDVIAMKIASESGVPIAKTTTDPGKLVEISQPKSTKDVTLDEE